MDIDLYEKVFFSENQTRESLMMMKLLFFGMYCRLHNQENYRRISFYVRTFIIRRRQNPENENEVIKNNEYRFISPDVNLYSVYC